MSWKICEKKRNLPEEPEKRRQISSRKSICGLRFEHGTSGM
jgi:hypothetical protein